MADQAEVSHSAFALEEAVNPWELNKPKYFINWQLRTGYEINYIITCGSIEISKKPAEIDKLINQLNKDYKLLYVTPSGMTKLFIVNYYRKADE